jgi:hypothetical protein
LKSIAIEVIGRLRIKIKNITKFESQIHSNKSLIEEKIWIQGKIEETCTNWMVNDQNGKAAKVEDEN